MLSYASTEENHIVHLDQFPNHKSKTSKDGLGSLPLGSVPFTYLLRGDPLGGRVEAQFLQRVRDLPARPHRNHAAQGRGEGVGTGVLGDGNRTQ